MKLFVWTLGYEPFALGGPPYRPMGCEVEAEGPFDIGQGYSAYVVAAPNGRTFVAESTSGAFVGPDLEHVRADVAEGDIEFMRGQVEAAVAQRKGARTIEPYEFWRRLKCHKPEVGK